jgi:hypothetical protein
LLSLLFFSLSAARFVISYNQVAKQYGGLQQKLTKMCGKKNELKSISHAAANFKRNSHICTSQLISS